MLLLSFEQEIDQCALLAVRHNDVAITCILPVVKDERTHYTPCHYYLFSSHDLRTSFEFQVLDYFHLEVG